ncbi:MAG TPA: MFS transporter [Candidatus Baltobacteraceae bacterium]|nr:MFS transporter [Candidatus Baltobacteraceae bacterium]
MNTLRIPAFRNLLIGATLSQLGDVCFSIALPWLVLQMTGSGIALGSILVALAIPRGALMLFGGALSDRVSARTILIFSNLALTLCVAAVAFLAAHHALALWMLYVVAIVFGVADAFANPATKVLIPGIVPRDDIAAANSLLQSSTQLCMLGGAAAAGLLIQHFGMVSAFTVDAFSFVFLIFALLSITAPAAARVQTNGLLAAIREGIAYVAQEPSLRMLLLVIASVNFCLTGATQVGIVTLVHARFGSAGTFGALVTVTAIGSLVGLLLAGVWKRRRNMLLDILGGASLLGVCLASLAIRLPFAFIFVALAASGAIAGYLNVYILSELQRSVSPTMLGRVMSLVTLSSVGIAPISLALSGVIAQSHVELLFALAGCALIAVSLIGAPLTYKSLRHSRSIALNTKP